MGVDWDRGAATSLLALELAPAPAPAPGKVSLPPFVLPSPEAPREQKGSRPGQMAHLTGQASQPAPQNTSFSCIPFLSAGPTPTFLARPKGAGCLA